MLRSRRTWFCCCWRGCSCGAALRWSAAGWIFDHCSWLLGGKHLLFLQVLKLFLFTTTCITVKYFRGQAIIVIVTLLASLASNSASMYDEQHKPKQYQ